jgi:hypothetical protein
MPAEPSEGYYAGLSYAFEFTANGRDPVPGSIMDGTGSVELEVGTWSLRVTGKNGVTEVLEGRATGIVITAGETTDVPVALASCTGSKTGTLTYSVTFPTDVTRGTLTVYGWDDGAAQGTPVNLLSGAVSGGDAKTTSGTRSSLPAGYYRIALDLFKTDGVLRRTDIAQIYPEQTTAAEYAVAAGDFIEASVTSTGSSFASVLEGISGLASGDNMVYFLSSYSETMAATSVSNPNGPVTVTIDGGGRSVTLSGTGSLITVGENVALVLKNIALRGRGTSVDNTAALVTVTSGGTLELETGASISLNRNVSSSDAYGARGGGVNVHYEGTLAMNGGRIVNNTVPPYFETSNGVENHYPSSGGGVYAVGTFAMNGGEISSNTVSSYSSASGGGVYSSGAFTMRGGKISGNTASILYRSDTSTSFASSSYGGGVYSDWTFDMSGGEISGNTVSTVASAGAPAYSSRSYGGGVYTRGPFAMRGGKISGNEALRPFSSTSSPYTSSLYASVYGGGVYAAEKASMSGGEISGNTARGASNDYSNAAYGGGVYVGSYSERNVSCYGTFTMNGGKITGNKVSSPIGGEVYGGGVYAAETFAMNGGEITGNEASSSEANSYGGGVYISDGGTFDMGGGGIAGNTASSPKDYAYGGGVYVDSGGTFDMGGGEIMGNKASSPKDYAYGNGVYTIGTFIMSGGARVNVNNTVCLYVYRSSHSYVTIGGDFAGPDGPVAKLDLSAMGSSGIPTALVLASGYSGDLSVLKSRFILGSYIVEEKPIGGVIGDDGILGIPAKPITDIFYSPVSGGVWTLLEGGKRQSPPIGDNSITKSRISFTTVDPNARITIQLEVSSYRHSYYDRSDWAFISLDDPSATYDSGYYFRISGKTSETVTIDVPTAGSHFVDVGYQKNGRGLDGSDCAWYEVVVE